MTPPDAGATTVAGPHIGTDRHELASERRIVGERCNVRRSVARVDVRLQFIEEKLL
ncbi:MAG: hypothetical protein ABI706_20745 [Ilumatobacteraceae bacterium]